jgi:uncharacterized protein YggE
MLARRAVVAVLALFSLAFPVAAARAQAKGVHVSGEATLRVPADTVTLALSMETIDDDLVRVRQTSDKQAQTILAHVKKQGGGEGAFQVTALSLTFGYNAQLKRQIYTVVRGLKVELGDLSKLDALLADLLKEQFLKIEGITFRTSKQREHEFAARAKAITDAKEKAKQLAELSGQKLGKAYNIQVVGERYVPFAASAAPSPASPAPPAGRDDLPRGAPAVRIERGEQSTPVALPFPAARAEETFIQAPAEGQAFVGEIVISAEVSIDFELE